jgi:hypothetical protein
LVGADFLSFLLQNLAKVDFTDILPAPQIMAVTVCTHTLSLLFTFLPCENSHIQFFFLLSFFQLTSTTTSGKALSPEEFEKVKEAYTLGLELDEKRQKVFLFRTPFLSVSHFPSSLLADYPIRGEPNVADCTQSVNFGGQLCCSKVDGSCGRSGASVQTPRRLHSSDGLDKEAFGWFFIVHCASSRWLYFRSGFGDERSSVVPNESDSSFGWKVCNQSEHFFSFLFFFF